MWWGGKAPRLPECLLPGVARIGGDLGATSGNVPGSHLALPAQSWWPSSPPKFFSSIFPRKRLGQQLLWGRASPYPVLRCRRSSKGGHGQRESMGGGQHPARSPAEVLCRGLNLHLQFWERAGKHFHLVSLWLAIPKEGKGRH